MAYINRLYTDQLIMDEKGVAVVAKLRHSFRKPTSVDCDCPIEVGDAFALDESLGDVPAGEHVRYEGVKNGKMLIALSDGEVIESNRRYSLRTVKTEDYDGREMEFTAYSFHGGPEIIVNDKHYWWHLFYSCDERRVVVAEISHAAGQKARSDYVNYVRYPSHGDTFKLGYRFNQYPTGSQITFVGVNGRLLLIRGPDGIEFEHEYFHQHSVNQSDQWSFWRGPKFTGQQIVLTDQQRYPEEQGHD